MTLKVMGAVPDAVSVKEFAWPEVKVAAFVLVKLGACANALETRATTRPIKPNRQARRRPRPTNECELGELCFMMKKPGSIFRKPLRARVGGNHAPPASSRARREFRGMMQASH